MNTAAMEWLTEAVGLADELLAGRATMLEPQDLPGRFGRVIRAADHVLQSMNCESVLAGGWAVWRHGFEGRMTKDVDIVLPADRVDEFLRVASVGGFEALPPEPGRWPKLRHKETGVKLDILPEGARPGTAFSPAPTTIPHPRDLGAHGSGLRYITLASLIELKLAADRPRDEADVAELLRANFEQADSIRDHLARVHPSYVVIFDRILARAREQQDQ